MQIQRLELLPEITDYAISFSEDTRQTGFVAPRSVFATNNAENAKTQEFTWLLSGIDYVTWFSFWETHVAKGLPFVIDLILDDYLLETYTAKFVPGTWQLASVQGDMYTVKVSLNVTKYEQRN